MNFFPVWLLEQLVLLHLLATSLCIIMRRARFHDNQPTCMNARVSQHIQKTPPLILQILIAPDTHLDLYLRTSLKVGGRIG